jgi:hypothetical protein
MTKTYADPKFPAGSIENRGEPMSIPVTVKVSPYTLASIIITAIEGGINYWCSKGRLHTEAEDDEGTHHLDTVVTERHPDEVYNEFLARNVALGGTFTLYEYDEVVDSEKPHTLSLQNLLHGFVRFIEEGRARGTLDDDGTMDFDLDAGDADVIIQYALFGELVYG